MLGLGTGAMANDMTTEAPRRHGIGHVLNSDKWFKWMIILPLLLVLATFMFYPMFYCMFFSSQEWGMRAPAEFIGWDNYRTVLHDMTFWLALGRTFQVLVIAIIAEIIIGLGIASLFNREFKGQNIVRGLCLLPLLISPLAMSMMWNFILQYDFGVINQVIQNLGGSKIMWWNPDYALYTITFIAIWQWFPFATFVLLAGMKSLPRDAFEAAKVDGASGWYTFRRLTLPMLTPLIMIIVLLRTMWLIRLFDPLYGTTRGGANTELLDWMVYRQAFVFFDIGIGSTLAMISLFITMIITAVMFRELMKAMGVLKTA
jgi:multiple sugar transport system permease protein